MEEYKRLQELAGVESSQLNEESTMFVLEKISDIIRNYCVGNEHLEFDRSDLSKMCIEIFDYMKSQKLD